jgi:aspartate/glutamate racemase
MSEKSYNVSYVANYFTLNTTIQAPNQDQAEALAKQNLLEEYGINLDECGAECIEVTTNV